MRGNWYFRPLGQRYNYHVNHNHNKIVKSDWLSTALISALIGQFNTTVRVMPKLLDSMRHHARALMAFFFSLLAKQNFEFLVFWFKK